MQRYFIVLVTILLVAIAGTVIYKVLRGDSDAAQSRAIAVSTPQGVSKLYENNPHMPPQARAAAEAAARAHGATMGGTNR